MNHMVVFWNPTEGRVLPSLLETLPHEELIIVSENMDQTSPDIPKALSSTIVTLMKPDEFCPIHEDEYTVIVNGEPTSQTLPIIKKLYGGWHTFRGKYKIIEITRTSTHTLDEREPLDPKLDDWSF